MRLIYEVPIALVYIQLHACLFFVNVATINVAINSADQALMTLLVSNNFAEIKTSVFKKFDANNLFQVASSDATERFKLFVFVSIASAQLPPPTSRLLVFSTCMPGAKTHVLFLGALARVYFHFVLPRPFNSTMNTLRSYRHSLLPATRCCWS